VFNQGGINMINNVNGYKGIQSNYHKQVNEPVDNKEKSDVVANNAETQTEDVAATYEKSPEVAINKPKESNQDIIARLKADTEMRTAQLESLVQKMFNKQGIKFSNSSEMYNILRSGKFTVDPETAAQAKKDISEDGYWGVEQTSDRMVDFAMALSGNDPAKADKMIEAVKKGYAQAEKTWGGELPSICKQTLETTISKLEEWRDGLNKDKTDSVDAVKKTDNKEEK